MEETFSDFLDFIRVEKCIITLFKETNGSLDLEVLGFSRNKENLDIDYIFKHCTDSDGGFLSNIYNNTKIRDIDVNNVSSTSSNKFANDLIIIYNEWFITQQQPFCMRINANFESSRFPK